MAAYPRANSQSLGLAQTRDLEVDVVEIVAREKQIAQEERNEETIKQRERERERIGDLLAGLALLYKWTPIASPSICSGGQVAAHS